MNGSFPCKQPDCRETVTLGKPDSNSVFASVNMNNVETKHLNNLPVQRGIYLKCKAGHEFRYEVSPANEIVS